MSWQIFKDNIVRMSDNPDAISDIDTVAKTYAREYDAAIKRGKDTIEGVSLQKGNVDIMEALFKAALQKGLTSTEPYDLVGEMGKGVLAYWGGAVMNNFPNPKTLPPGAVSNISVTSNVVMSPGQWNPPIVQPALSWPPDDMLDPSQVEAGDDSPSVELEKAEEVLGPVTLDALLPMESRQPKNINEIETILIQNPEEIIIDSSITISAEDVIRIEEGSSEYTGGQRPNENNTDDKKTNYDDDRTPVRIYKDVGINAMPTPPNWDKYKMDPAKRTDKWGGKDAGPNGAMPYDALEKITGGGYAHPEAAKFMNIILALAKKEGIKGISISSTYRDYAGQVTAWKNSGGSETKKGDGTAATPGYSAHGWAVAVDFGELAVAQAAWASAQKPKPLGRGNPLAADYIRRTHPLYEWLSKNAPKYGWYNPARLVVSTAVQETWHWEYWGFYTLSKEERQSGGASVAPTGTTTKTDTKTQKTNSTTPAGYVTYNMDLNGPVAFIFGGIPSDKSGAKYMDSQIPLNIKKTKKIVVSNWENLQNNKFLKDFPNVKISSISGWSKAGEFIIPNIESYLKSGYFVGLIDPSVTQKYTQTENANLKMIYRPENWSTQDGIAFGTNLASFGKSMGASAQLTTSGHYLIPGEFFKQFGNKL